jgi:hypothetical protein
MLGLPWSTHHSLPFHHPSPGRQHGAELAPWALWAFAVHPGQVVPVQNTFLHQPWRKKLPETIGIGPAFLHLPSRAGGKQNNTANFTDSPLILRPFSVHPIGPSGAHDSTFDQPSWAPTSKVSKHDLTRIDLTHQKMT